QLEAVAPRVAGIEKEHRPDVADERQARLERRLEQRVPADGQARPAQWAHLEPPPAAKAAGAAKEVALEERHVGLELSRRVDRGETQTPRHHQAPEQRGVETALGGVLAVVEVAGQPLPRLFHVGADEVTLPGID